MASFVFILMYVTARFKIIAYELKPQKFYKVLSFKVMLFFACYVAILVIFIFQNFATIQHFTVKV